MRNRIIGPALAAAATILIATASSPAHADDATPTDPAVITTPILTLDPSPITPLDTYWGS